MLYLFYGANHNKLRAKLASFRDALHKKRPNAELFKLDDPQEVTSATLQELVGGMGLFEQKYIVQLDRVLEDAQAREVVTDQLEAMADSDNVFLVVEGALDANTRKKLEKHASETYSFEKAKQTEEFKPFAMTDALGKKDKKTLWVEFWKARRAEKEIEEIHGVLFWQIKSMLLASAHGSAEEAGMKAFPYKKAKQFAGNFSEDELRDLSRRFVTCYHEARRGNGELADNLERVILAL